MRHYESGKHSFFDDLAAFLAALSALGLGLEATMKGQTRGWAPHEDLILEGLLEVDLKFAPHELLTTIIGGEWPTTIDLQDTPIPHREPDPPTTVLRGSLKLHRQLIVATFVRYFEAYKPAIEAQHGKNPYGWPAVWNFARVVRNAFAHGEIHFRSSRSAPVTWKTLTYGPSDNGKGRIVVPTDMTPADVILLMEQMDAAL